MNNFNSFVKTSTNTINISVDNIEVDNELQVTNQLDINQSGDILTTGNITCANILCNSINLTSFSSINLNVSGTANLNGAVSAFNTLNVSGGATFENVINSKNTLTTNNLNVTNNTTFNGAVTAKADLNISGISTLNVVNISGLTNIYNNINLNNGKLFNVSNLDNTGLPLNISTVTDHDITLARYTGVSLILKNNYINNNGDVITSGNLTLNSALNVSGVSTLGNTTTNNITSNSLFCGNINASVLNLGTSASSINIGCGSALQTVNIGSSGGGTTTINIGETTSDIVNIAGTIVNVTSQNLLVTDKLISLNVGAVGASTARNSGLQIRDNNIDNQAYIQTSSTGDFYNIKAPENNFILNTPVLTQNETIATTANISGLTSIYQTITNVSNLSANSAFKTDISGLSSIYFKQSGGVITGATSINSTLNTTNDLTVGDSIGQKILNINSGASQNSLLRFNTNKTAENWSHWVQPNSDYNFIYRNGGGADFIIESYLQTGGKITNSATTMTSSLNISGPTQINSTFNVSRTSILNGATTCASTLNVDNITNIREFLTLGKGTNDPILRFNNNNTDSQSYTLWYNTAGNRLDTVYRNSGGGDSILNNVNASGNIGINTISQQTKLQIDYDNNSTNYTGVSAFGSIHLCPTNNNNDNWNGITFGAIDPTQGSTRKQSQAGIICQSSSAYGTRFIWETSNSYATGMLPRMMLSPAGTLGIGYGTTQPNQNYKLDVNGDINVSSSSWFRTNGNKNSINIGFRLFLGATPSIGYIRPSGWNSTSSISRSSAGVYTLTLGLGINPSQNGVCVISFESNIEHKKKICARFGTSTQIAIDSANNDIYSDLEEWVNLTVLYD